MYKLVQLRCQTRHYPEKNQNLQETRNCTKAKMLEMKKKTCARACQKSKNKLTGSERFEYLPNYVRVHLTYSRKIKRKGCGEGKEPSALCPAILDSATKQAVTLHPTQLIQVYCSENRKYFPLFICKLDHFTSSKHFSVFSPSTYYLTS